MKDFSPLAFQSAVIGFPSRVGAIIRADGTEILFTDADVDITVDGDTFLAIPGLKISAVKHTSNGAMPSCQMIGVYGSGEAFDSDDLDIGLFDGASAQIYKVDRMNLTRKGLEFTGAISNISLDPIQHQFSFDVRGPASFARRVMTQRRSPMCRTDFGSVLCGINLASYSAATTVDAMGEGAFTFTVTGSLAQPDGYFNQGILVTSNDRNFEIANWVQSTQTITTYLPCRRLLTPGLALTLYKGCDKTLTGANGCASVNNQINFVGEPHFLGTAAAAQQV